MKQDISRSGGVEFVPATCPNCGGELRVPTNRDFIKCMYCGSDVILRDPTKITIETVTDIEKIFKLAKIAEKAKNYVEAYQYYSRISEQDPDYSLAC